MVGTLTRNWGWVALRGVVAILFGALTIFNPGITLVALLMLFGAYALVDGIFAVVASLAHRRGEPRWAALLFSGIMGIAIGVVTFMMPGATARVLLAVIAVWAIVIGFAEIMAAVRLRKEITGEWLFIVAGLLAVVFGAILILAPGAGALALVMWVGLYAMISGVLLVAFSFRLRTWGLMHPAT